MTPDFEAISPGLPSHQDELMAAHQGAPGVAVQNVTHGAPAPAKDLGQSEQVKYGSAPPVC